ncbi:MAG: polyprenyl synthetase family protein [Candidatus Micrarchaeota archaeon]
MDIYPQISPLLSDIERIMEAELGKEDPRIYGMLAPFIKRGGKRIRPALCMLSCGAGGGQHRDAVGISVIIELFHNFTLIHDDIEDDAQFRRGEPALHISHGTAMALNSGDALYTLLWRKLVCLDIPPSKLRKMQKMSAEAFKRVVDGQGIEISWIKEGRFDIGEADYLAMIGGKTSALMGLSCEVGAFLGGAKAPVRSAMRSYGELLGAAFQIHDDVLNLTGDFSKYQKEIGGDITEGKRTLMVVHCLANAPESERKELVSILSSHTREKAAIGRAIAILGAHGSIDYARSRAESLVAKARQNLSKLPDSPDRSSLDAIARFVIGRER